MNDQAEKMAIEYLNTRGVLPETFKAHGCEITGVDRDRVAQELNWNPSTRKSQKLGWAEAILHFPIFGPNGTGQHESWILKVLPSKGNSPPPLAPKFRVPTGKRSPIWIPQVTWEAVKDVSQPLIVTEGPVKGLAVSQAGGKPIASQGVWGVAEPKPKPQQLTGSFEADEEETGKAKEEYEQEQVTPEPEHGLKLRKELLLFRWLRRKVYLGFDTDQLSNPNVRQAVIRSFFLFSVQGAEVYQLEWPPAEGKGIDDYLRTRGLDEANNNDPEKQKSVLAEVVASAKLFLECLTPADVDLFARELFNVKMSEARREQFAKLGALKLKTTKAALLAGKADGVGQGHADEGVKAPPTAQPWKSNVVARDVLEEIQKELHQFVWMQSYQSRAVALWITLSYLHDAVSILPLLLITSPEPDCGKSTLLELVFNLSNRPIPASNISAAAMYRTIKDDCPTFVLDEADTFIKDDEVLRGVINSGHKRAFAWVIRVINDKGETGRFSTWCPKAIAMIGLPKGTILSRSIHIRLQRKGEGQETKLLTDDHYADSENLRRKISRLANDIRAKVRAFKEVNLLRNRAGDNWRPLFAIAREAGEEWTKETVRSAQRIQRRVGKDTLSFGQYLIAALGELVRQKREKRGIPATEKFFIKTEDILDWNEGLNSDNEAPWAELQNGLTAHRLRKELRAYEVESHVEDVAGTNPKIRKQARGYWSDELEKVALQYKRQDTQAGSPK